MEAAQPSSDDAGTIPLFRWYSMSAREQGVWSAAYVAAGPDAKRSAQSADQAVSALRSLAIDESQFIGPEHDAARYCLGLTFEEFSGWYPTALKITSRGRLGQKLSDEDLSQAFEAYRMSTADFF